MRTNIAMVICVPPLFSRLFFFPPSNKNLQSQFQTLNPISVPNFSSTIFEVNTQIELSMNMVGVGRCTETPWAAANHVMVLGV
jgi:hypothetical protein